MIEGTGRPAARLARVVSRPGADEAVGEQPTDRFRTAAQPEAPARGPVQAASGAVRPAPPAARAAMRQPAGSPVLRTPAQVAQCARGGRGMQPASAELEAALARFDGCALKKTALTTVLCRRQSGGPR